MNFILIKIEAKSYSPNDNQIKQIIDLHNRARSQVSPTSSNMRAVSWDFDLSRLAQRWAENCVFDHDCNSCRILLNNQTISVGQNAYAFFSSDNDANTFWLNVVDLWLQETSNFQYGVGSLTGSFFDIGHYTQIINADAVRIGCGAAICGDSTTYAYCNYALGQSDTRRPYSEGTPCSNCSPRNCRDNLCFCDKLCQNFGTLDQVNCKCNCEANFSGDLCEIRLNNNQISIF